jgi:hypothetical protein
MDATTDGVSTAYLGCDQSQKPKLSSQRVPDRGSCNVVVLDTPVHLTLRQWIAVTDGCAGLEEEWSIVDLPITRKIHAIVRVLPSQLKILYLM